jgi:hypothetical protein
MLYRLRKLNPQSEQIELKTFILFFLSFCLFHFRTKQAGKEGGDEIHNHRRTAKNRVFSYFGIIPPAGVEFGR